jgi:hypothetical protein
VAVAVVDTEMQIEMLLVVVVLVATELLFLVQHQVPTLLLNQHGHLLVVLLTRLLLVLAVLAEYHQPQTGKPKGQTVLLPVLLEQDLQPSARVVAVVAAEHSLEVALVVLEAAVVAGTLAVLPLVVLEQQMKVATAVAAVTFMGLVAVAARVGWAEVQQEQTTVVVVAQD